MVGQCRICQSCGRRPSSLQPRDVTLPARLVEQERRADRDVQAIGYAKHRDPDRFDSRAIPLGREAIQMHRVFVQVKTVQ